MAGNNIKFRQREAEKKERQVQQVIERMKTQETFEKMCYQSEEDEKKINYEKEKRKIEERMALIKEGDHPEANIHRFEEVMREVEVPQRK